jgi:hypothetical protein
VTGTTVQELLRQHRSEIIAAAARRGASNLRVFGSVARGDEPFIPPRLASLVAKLLAEGPPPHPIDISDPPTTPPL